MATRLLKLGGWAPEVPALTSGMLSAPKSEGEAEGRREVSVPTEVRRLGGGHFMLCWPDVAGGCAGEGCAVEALEGGWEVGE